MIEYILPFYNGNELTVMIRKYLSENAPHLPQPYIVCMTSIIHEHHFKAKALEEGMDIFAFKPIFRPTI